jgi:PleD family two-component response regulator
MINIFLVSKDQDFINKIVGTGLQVKCSMANIDNLPDNLDDYDIIMVDEDHKTELKKIISMTYSPVIVLCNEDNEDVNIKYLKMGVNDCVVNNGKLNPRGLRRIITHTVGRESCKYSISENKIMAVSNSLEEQDAQLERTAAIIGELNATYQKYFAESSCGAAR